MFYKNTVIFFCCWMVGLSLYAQVPADSLSSFNTQSSLDSLPLDSLRQDSLRQDSIRLDSISRHTSPISSPIVYSASDSIILTGKGVAQLFGKADVTYGELGIKSDYLRFNSDSSLIHAEGVPDTSGVIQGKPLFKQGSNEYEMNEVDYNLKTKKSFIVNATTQQGEGYVTSMEAKKDSNNVVCMRNGWYTTCDNHEHPHFYLAMTKAKVNPGKSIISGPSYLVLEDVPLYPIFIPFGYFPTSSSYSSGILMPAFGYEQSRGYYLQGGGYYWATSQYNDLAIRGDIFANGSWAIRAQSKYRLIYKFSGGFSADYQVTNVSEKGLNDFRQSRDFKIIWNHSQDAKANPYSTFSAGVNFSTSSYEKNNSGSVYNPDLISQNAKQSSINYTKRWPESPWAINANMNVSQNTLDSSISASLPIIAVSMSRIYPFKKKNSVGTPKWYESLGVNYSGGFTNSITAKEDEILKSSIFKDWNNGADHKINASTSIKALNVITLSPSVNYEERWYTKSIRMDYDDVTNRPFISDTVAGFHRAYDYSLSVSASTKLYGFYRPFNFVNRLMGDKVEAIRHVLTPTAGFSYRPDFGDPKYGYYEAYYTLLEGDNGYYSSPNYYSIFQNGVYSPPSRGKSGSANFSISNIVDMKLRTNEVQSSDSDDTTSTNFKKLTLLESFVISSNYNFLADSLNWSNISMTGRTTIFKGLSITFGANYDPYSYAFDENGNIKRVGTSYWTATNHRSIAHLTNANITSGYSFNNESFKRKKKDEKESRGGSGFDGNSSIKEKESRSKSEKDDTKDEYGYDKFQIPWNLSINYSVQASQSGFDTTMMKPDLKLTQTLGFSGGISLTPNWKLTLTSGWDFIKKDLSYTSIGMTRDLHCWRLTGSVIPLGQYKSYNFTIAVSSSILQDLKWNQRNDPRINPDF